jgi:hypothetical protein
MLSTKKHTNIPVQTSSPNGARGVDNIFSKHAIVTLIVPQRNHRRRMDTNKLIRRVPRKSTKESTNSTPHKSSLYNSVYCVPILQKNQVIPLRSGITTHV